MEESNVQPICSPVTVSVWASRSYLGKSPYFGDVIHPCRFVGTSTANFMICLNYFRQVALSRKRVIFSWGISWTVVTIA